MIVQPEIDLKGKNEKAKLNKEWVGRRRRATADDRVQIPAK